MKLLEAFLIGLIVMFISVGVFSVVIYFAGLFVISTFAISFNWTFAHALAIAFVLWILQEIFRK